SHVIIITQKKNIKTPLKLKGILRRIIKTENVGIYIHSIKFPIRILLKSEWGINSISMITSGF
ncbi:hypothetical protein, partial [Yersinia pestis]